VTADSRKPEWPAPIKKRINSTKSKNWKPGGREGGREGSKEEGFTWVM